MDDLAVTCDEIKESYNEETKIVPTNFNEIKLACETQNFYILLAFLLITVALLITVSYCYLIEYRAKQKHLLPFHVTNENFKKVKY